MSNSVGTPAPISTSMASGATWRQELFDSQGSPRSIDILVRGNLSSSVCRSRSEKRVCSWSLRASYSYQGYVFGLASSERVIDCGRYHFFGEMVPSFTWLIALPSYLCWTFLGVVDSPSCAASSSTAGWRLPFSPCGSKAHRTHDGGRTPCNPSSDTPHS